jgi:prepilin-type N-terminal cleavage/methylation domain-containing protein
MKANRGVTLMELLIAITLLSLLSVGLLFALRIGMTAYSKTQSRLMDNRRVAGAQRILEQELEGMVPVVAMCGGGPEGGGQRGPFFQGDMQTMRLVSTFSLQGAWRGQTQILEIFVIPGAEEGVRLVVNELPYMGPVAAAKLCQGQGTVMRASPGPASFVLADKLAFCKFSYLAKPKDMMLPPLWGPLFTSATWPRAVRIDMAPLVPDPSRLQPITTIAPLRIYRAAEVDYVDQ